MNTWSETLLGSLIPAMPVPFGRDSNLDMEAQSRLTSWIGEQPIDGVAVWTSTGRGDKLSPDQREIVLNSWREAMGPERHVIAEISASLAVKDVPPELLDLIDIVLMHPGSNAGPGAETDTSKLISAVRTVDKPVILSLSNETQIPMTDFDRLLEMDEVAGIRASGPVTFLQDIITHMRIQHPSKAVLAGEERLLGYSFYRGCHGAISSLASVCPSLQKAMIDAWFMGEPGRFLEISRMVDHIAEAVFVNHGDDGVRKILTGLVHLGIVPHNASHDPWGPEISEVDEELVRATLDALGEWWRMDVMAAN